MNDDRYTVLRDWIALILVAITCPLAVFGGANIGCVGQGFTSECAMSAAIISPVILLISGVIAGFITKGWTGLMVVGLGTIAGMFLILLASYAAGRPVPVDWFSGLVATIWFMAPIVIGYGVGRAVWRLMAARRGKGGSTGS